MSQVKRLRERFKDYRDGPTQVRADPTRPCSKELPRANQLEQIQQELAPGKGPKRAFLIGGIGLVALIGAVIAFVSIPRGPAQPEAQRVSVQPAVESVVPPLTKVGPADEELAPLPPQARSRNERPSVARSDPRSPATEAGERVRPKEAAGSLSTKTVRTPAPRQERPVANVVRYALACASVSNFDEPFPAAKRRSALEQTRRTPRRSRSEGAHPAISAIVQHSRRAEPSWKLAENR
jgi:hypothetical protein